MTDSVNFLVSCHNVDACNWYWDLGGAGAYEFTYMYATYCV